MGLTVILILIALLVPGFFFIRRVKQRDHSMNRYRNYHTRIINKEPKVRRNRYHKTSRRETDLGYQPPGEMEAMIAEVKKPEPVIRADVWSDDPDVVLGLKEPPASNSNREKPIPTEAQIILKPPPPPPPIITFYVVAEDTKPFNGYELLQAILSIGARYGEHQIFHRHQEKTGHGPVLFSLASATQPGTFDLTKMGGFSTPGLSLFFCAADVDDPIAVYELMLQTAGQLIEDLGGHVLDKNRYLLTPTTVVVQRRLLHDYIQGQQIPDLFEEMVQ